MMRTGTVHYNFTSCLIIFYPLETFSKLITEIDGILHVLQSIVTFHNIFSTFRHCEHPHLFQW
jgi:hypothetical protein